MALRSLLLYFGFLVMLGLPGFTYARPGDTLQYQLLHYTADNGLPQNSVKSIFYTKQGVLWLATEGGLTCFDGNSFKVFDKTNTLISSNRFIKIGFDYELGKQVALTSNFEKLEIPDGNTVFPFNIKPVLTANSKERKKESDPRLPVHGINRTTSSVPPPFYIPVSNDETFIIDNGNVHFQKNDKTIWTCPSALFSRHYSYFDGFFRYFVIGKQLFRISDHCAFSILGARGATGMTVSGDLLKNKAYGNSTEIPNAYWTQEQDCPIIYFNKSWYLVSLTNDGRLQTKLIVSGFSAHEQNIFSAWYDPYKEKLFLGSSTEGLFILTPKKFKSLVIQKPEYSDSYYSLVSYGADKILTASGYLMNTNGKITPLPELVKRTDGYSITSDKTGLVYIKRDQFLYCFRDIKRPPVASWSFPNNLTQLYLDSISGILWIGTRSGLYQLDTRQLYQQPVLVNPNIREVSYLQKDFSNYLWIGTGKGCYRMPLTNRQRLDTIPALNNKYVRCISVFHPGEVWITTYEDGFYLYQNGKLTQFPVDKNKFLLTSHSILEDAQGFLWISTNKGLFQASRQELLSYAAQPSGRPYYVYYSTRSGFLTNEFNGGGQAGAITLPDRRFAFSSLKGVVLFDPAFRQPDNKEIAIFVNNIFIDNLSVAITDSIHLSKNFNRLRIDVSVPFSDNLNDLNLEYRRVRNSSSDAEWLPLENNSLTLWHFTSGSYSLQIRAKNEFHYNSFVYKTIFIEVEPRFYEHPLFFILVLLLLTLLVYTLVRLRVRHLSNRNKQLDRIIAERTRELHTSLQALEKSEANLLKGARLQEKMIASISHDIQSPLKFLMMVTKRNYYKSEASDPISLEEVKLVYQTSHQLHSFTEKMLQYIKTKIKADSSDKKVFSVHQLAAAKLDFFADIAITKNNQLVNNIIPGLCIREREELLGIIIHNLVDNANKFTANGTIAISALMNNHSLIITISDSGVGISPGLINDYSLYFADAPGIYKKPKGLGFEIIKELSSILSANIAIQGEEGKGTSISITLNNVQTD